MKKTCVVCNETFERPAGMSPSKWEQRRTCGNHECRTKLSRVTGRREPDFPPPIDGPDPRQVNYARHSATKAELRLMSPAILAAAGVRA